MNYSPSKFYLLVAVGMVAGCMPDTDRDTPLEVQLSNVDVATASDPELDALLAAALEQHGFTGRVGISLESRLGRSLNPQLANVGRLIFFDRVTGLGGDNSCAGCHGPQNSFGDSKSIAIGVGNNGFVGPSRAGPRNQRRSPSVVNTAFFPTLMWNSRFAALSGNPFDNSAGFSFPPPEGMTLSHMQHLLGAQAHIPFTERVEMAGFDFPGGNDDIRAEVLRRLNGIGEYRRLFGQVFPEVKKSAIRFEHIGAAVAEFTFSLVFANAPIDRYARGDRSALTPDQKRGALSFFGRARCVECHAVSGTSNEMFSDFREHVIGVPQIAPTFGNVPFDGPGADEDFGLEQVTGDRADRYAFRSSPLRNVGLQPTFMHNGAFVRLEDAIRHHLDVQESLRSYTPADLEPDLRERMGPSGPVLARLDAKLRTPIRLSDSEFGQLVDFVRNALTDPNALPARLRGIVPSSLPSGQPLHTFEFR